jgi:hypothetical protein
LFVLQRSREIYDEVSERAKFLLYHLPKL